MTILKAVYENMEPSILKKKYAWKLMIIGSIHLPMSVC